MNGGDGSRAALLQSMIMPGLACRRQAAPLIEDFDRFRQAVPDDPAWGPDCPVPVYDGQVPQVQAMMEQLAPLQAHLRGAYVHGSLATSDAVPYSDFDGLVILRDELFQVQEHLVQVAHTLNRLRRTMFEFDPLQHHGWFVLTEADLCFYCDAYFPFELFRYSRSLLQGDSTLVRVAARDSGAEYKAVFRQALAGMERKLTRGAVPDNMFALKSLLSEIMLAPALFIQAKTGRAIYKGDSFDVARRYFDDRIWAPMDQVSSIRRQWHYSMGPLRRVLLTRLVATRRLATRWFSPPVPADIAMQLTPAWTQATVRLLHTMREIVEQTA